MDPFLERFLRELGEALIPVLASGLAALLGLAVWELRKWLRAKVGAEGEAFVERLVRQGVLAAEQWYASEDGKAKKAYVIDYVQRRAAERGKKIEVAPLVEYVEAVLAQLKIEGLDVVSYSLAERLEQTEALLQSLDAPPAPEDVFVKE